MRFPERKYFNSIPHLRVNSTVQNQLYLKYKNGTKRYTHNQKTKQGNLYNSDKNKKSVSAIKLNITVTIKYILYRVGGTC
jgi:hypothetical protein